MKSSTLISLTFRSTKSVKPLRSPPSLQLTPCRDITSPRLLSPCIPLTTYGVVMNQSLVTLPRSGGDTSGLTGDYVTISTGCRVGSTVFWTFFFHVVGFARIPLQSLRPSWSYLSLPPGGVLLSDCLGGQVCRGLEIGEVGPLTLQHLLSIR
jgi:hypothetical protein